jgi:hypothetical protein
MYRETALKLSIILYIRNEVQCHSVEAPVS